MQIFPIGRAVRLQDRAHPPRQDEDKPQLGPELFPTILNARLIVGYTRFPFTEASFPLTFKAVAGSDARSPFTQLRHKLWNKYTGHFDFDLGQGNTDP